MKLIEQLFSIKNNQEKTHKIITILGIKIKLKRKTKRKTNKNAKLNNFGIKTQNKEVVILGNGPSLKDALADSNFWEFIKNKDVFCVNSFPTSENYLKIKPKYLVFMDPAFWCKNLLVSRVEGITKIVENIKNATWEMHIFMPAFAKEWNWFKEAEKENDNIKISYLCIQDYFGNDDIERFSMYKENSAMPSPQNVLIACIYCAINIGYKKIYIFGADHTWHLALVVRDDNLVCIQDKHFYDGKEEVKLTPMYKNPEGKDPFTMKELMRAYMTTYEKYEILEEYSKYIGSKIYNMSKISYIDAFERKKLEEI